MGSNDLNKKDITPYGLYLNRRKFIETSIYAATGLASFGIYRLFRKNNSEKQSATDLTHHLVKKIGDEHATSLQNITNYNNFYEFSTDKEAVAAAAQSWRPQEWNLEIGGLVRNPLKLNLSDIQGIHAEERIYRFRCVEGWSMVIPWQGFPLSYLLEKAMPESQAKYVAFESYFDEKDMPNARAAGIPFPYVEGLRLDEAMHPLALLATGLYEKPMPSQNGAPIRLVVPWKYGFKSVKSIVKIILTDKEPPTTWSKANSGEYGFYSNVNPHVDHPRWSQKQERRIGEITLRDTLMFNGYEEQVGSLYKGMDLKKYF